MEADPGEFDQVLLNLVLNARDAMPTGGTLELETRQVVIGSGDEPGHPELTPGPYVHLRVTDSGIGMDQDTLDKVFEPFFSTKEEGRGVGLGLAMVHGAVSRAGGYIEASSVPGRGSTFRLLLPLVAEEHRRPPATGAQAEEKNGS